ncbi:hypothetical protein [Wenyingzhuangia sp. 2_MG-2023]|nr:hypothetical protein [Wenyingzhuangia sp. 2_MG-2023]MDO6739356.1 hypothetical protein [Wenyingzhuangia sp. 2_MG-2023]
MNFKKILWIPMLFCLGILNAQTKAASISGDAATLINLLDKNYSYESDDSIQELLIDQEIVLGIFKSYISLTKVVDKNNESEISKLKQELLKLNNSLNIVVENDRKNDTIEKISRLKKELLVKLETQTVAQFDESKIGNNEYLKKVFEEFKTKYDAINSYKYDSTSKYNTNETVQKSLPFLSSGNIGFETFVEVLKDHIVEQVKAELSNFVIENVKEKLENPNYYSVVNEIKILLPKTYSYIIQFNIDEMSDFTSRVKENVETDLNNLLENATNLTQSPRFKHLIEKNPDLKFAFLALNIVSDLSKAKNPIDYFETLETSDMEIEFSSSLNEKKKNIANSIKLMSLLAHSLTETNEEGVKFVSVDFMSSYGTRPEFFLLYFGFLHEQNKKFYNLEFYSSEGMKPTPIKINELFTKIPPEKVLEYNTDAIQIQNQLTSIVKNAEKIYQNIKEIRKADNDDVIKITPQQTHSFVNDFIDFIDQIVLVGINITDKMQTTETYENHKNNYNNIKPFINTAKQANDIVLSLNEKKYANAVLTALKIPEEISSDTYTINKLLSIHDKLENIEPLYLSFLVLKDDVKFPDKESSKEEFKYLLEALKLSIKKYDFKEVVDKKQIVTEIEKLETTIDKNKDSFKESINNFKITISESVIKSFSDSLLNIVNKKLPEFNKEDYPCLKELFNAKIKKRLKLNMGEIKITELEKKATDELITNLPTLALDIAKIDDENVRKIIYFLGDVAKAEDKQDLQLAFSNYTSKEGYRKKRNAAFDVSINSFPGFYGGLEYSEVNKKGEFITGVSIPVGINASFFSLNTWIQSVDVYLSIMDVAAPFRLRIDGEDNTKTVSDYNFENIFTPGVYLSFPIRKSPFAFNIGAQYGPQLRYDEGNGDFVNKEAYSIRAGLVVDIPLFTLYNRPKSR